jgi:hypothetical protein
MKEQNFNIDKETLKERLKKLKQQQLPYDITEETLGNYPK